MGKRHNPEEIIGKLRVAEIVLAQGGNDGRCMSSDRGYRADLLPLAQGIWRPENRPGAADEESGEGEWSATPGNLGSDARQADLAGGSPGKLLSPARRRRCVDHARGELAVWLNDGSAGCLARIDRRSARCRAGRMIKRRSLRTSLHWPGNIGNIVVRDSRHRQ